MNPNRGYRKANLPENAKRVFEGKIFDVYQSEQELYDGTTAIFEKIVRPDTIMVFPVLPDGRILMIEDTQPLRDTILTVPSGRIEEGETPEIAARRELLEETGYETDALEPLFEERPLSKMDWVVYGFIGRNAKKVREPKPDPGEKIMPRIITFDELIASVTTGRALQRDFGRIVMEAVLNPMKMDELRKKFLG